MPQHPGKKGGRIAPDGRPVQAKGVGKNSKRHDLERRDVPFLHDSDLQQGDVQAMEQGQRVAPKQTQRPAGPAPSTGGGGATTRSPSAGPTGIPDPIDFISQMASGGVNPPPAGVRPSANMDMWVRFARHLVNGPGSSGLLAGAYINQIRQLRTTPQVPTSTVVNLRDVDDALEAALDEQQANAQGN